MTDDPIPLDEHISNPALDEAGYIPSLEPVEPDVDTFPDLESVPMFDPILEALIRLDRRVSDLQGVFEREVRAEATREKVVDRLHAELQDARQDLLLNAMRPIFLDLIQLHDDIGKVAVCPDGAEEPVQRLVGLVKGFQQGIEDILYRQGVEPFESEGTSFDPRRHSAITTVPTEDPALNKTIASRIRKGFLSREKVIRAEIVSVYAMKK